MIWWGWLALGSAIRISSLEDSSTGGIGESPGARSPGLLMDEPFGSLDADMRAQMRRDVKALFSRLGTTAILVTHDQEEAFLMADRILILNRGSLLQLNTPDNIYHRPASRFEARFVGLAEFVPAELEDRRVVTELGEFPYEGSAPAEAVDLLVRPDDIEIEPDGSGDGVIVGREFKGADNLYSIRLPSGRLVRAVQPSGACLPRWGAGQGSRPAGPCDPARQGACGGGSRGAFGLACAVLMFDGHPPDLTPTMTLSPFPLSTHVERGLGGEADRS